MNSERDDIVLSRPDGRVVAREVMRVIFFMDRSHASLYEPVRAALEGFVDLVSFHELPYFYDAAGDPQPLVPENLPELVDDAFMAPVFERNGSLELVGNGGAAPRYGCSYVGSELGQAELPDQVSQFHVWMPRAAYLADAGRVDDYVRRLAVSLPFASGYMDLALVGHRREIQGLAGRYRGLDIAHPDCVAMDIGRKSPGAYWRTFLNPDASAALGGAQALRASGLRVEALGAHGLMVELGPEPELEDLNRRERAQLRRLFARLLDRHGLMHVPERVVYFRDERGFADREAMLAWHRRWLET